MFARTLLRAELRHGARRHLAVVALLAAVATAVTLAAVIGRMATDPWERTWRATGAAHLTVVAHDRAALRGALATIPGITESSGPIESGFAGMYAGGLHVETRLAELPSDARAPGRPAIAEGSAASAGEVMLAASPAASASRRATAWRSTPPPAG